jgi:beta-N-acetylhexosaminidase
VARKAIDNKAKAFIEGLIAKMTVEQKVGQLFTYMWSGTMVTPGVVDAIQNLHAGALRIQPFCLGGKRLKYYGFDTTGKHYDYPKNHRISREIQFSGCHCVSPTPAEYAETINKLQQIATERPCGIPMTFSSDMEGDFARDFFYNGTNLFPSAMGLAATGSVDMIYEARKAAATQLSALGITTLHSPVVDINVNPKNPEINTRSYGDDPHQVAEYALAAMKGLQDGGLLVTAKHYPGRGDSEDDAHFGVPVLDVDRKRLDDMELVPYRKLIANGVDSIMIAHNLYPCLDRENLATVSRKILTGLLREEMGFEGVITTDAIGMGALMEKHGLPEACALSIQAGCDMVLNKYESTYRDQGFCETLKYVQDGKIPMNELDDKVRRILTMKYKVGLFECNQMDPDEADAPIHDPKIIELADTVARRCAMVLRDEDQLMPLDPKKNKVLVIEQKMPERLLAQDSKLHRLVFSETMWSHSMDVECTDIEFTATEDDERFVLPLVEASDIIVLMNHYWRGGGDNNAFVKKVLATGKKVIIVTNTPYELSVPAEARNVICIWSSTPESLRVAADILFGKEKPQGVWPLKNTPMK